MKKHIFLMLLILTARNQVVTAQGISNNWLTGYSGGFGETKLDFTNGVPLISQFNIPMDFNHTHANISDTAGSLLIYTNGHYIADAAHDTIQNGGGINPSAFTSAYPDGLLIPQQHLILNRTNNFTTYDMFHGTLDNYPSLTDVLSFNLYHTVIDMSLNGGLGGVTQKNQVLINDSLVPGKVVACKHANGRDWWVFVFRSHSNKIYKILFLHSGVALIYSQNIGLTRSNFYGQAKFSSDGKKFAVYKPGYPTVGKLEIFDFDRCVGQLSNPVIITFSGSNVFNTGIEFSPNSQFLYATTGNMVYQFDVTSPNIAATQQTVAVQDTFYQPGFPSLTTGLCLPQLAPDGKIYITTGNGTTYFGRIDSPDSLGLACNVAQHSVVLPTYNYNTLPNHPNYFLGCDTTLGCICAISTGIEDVGVQNIAARASPNPTTGVFTLKFNGQRIAGTLEIYDVMGNAVRREYVAPWSQFKKIDISHLASGIYMCKLNWSGSCGSVKVIKE